MLQLWFVVNTLLWPINVHIGDNALGLNTVLMVSGGTYWIGTRRRLSKFTVKTAICLVLFFLLSSVIALKGPCEDKFFKSFLSAPLLFVLICIGIEISKQAKPQDWLKMQQTALWILIIAASFVVFEFFLPNLFSPEKAAYHLEGKYSGLYSEPSLLAISLFTPVALLLSSQVKKYNRCGVIALLFFLLFSRSSTLILLTFCYVLYRSMFSHKISQIFRYVLAIIGIVCIASYINFDLLIAPTIDRIAGITKSSNQNLSSLIYIKGWQDAWANINRTNGLGLGFNMMGCTPLPAVPVRNILKLDTMALNDDDGSFLFSKIVSETGLIGVCFFIWIVWSWIAYERKTRKLEGTVAFEIASVHTTFMFCFVFSSLVRTAGYFQGGGLLWVTAAVAAYHLQRENLIKSKLPIVERVKLVAPEKV
ncbi:MAG: hypothetical protein M0T70_11190 [Geobacteraceae bacterium]|nr:hypothetical protein [Geobacteraceae bacterium]